MTTSKTALEQRTGRRHTAILLVSAVDRRIVPALNFVARLRQADLCALHVSTDGAETRQLANEWIDLGLTWLPLHVRDASADGLLASIKLVVGERVEEAGEVTVVLPELEHRRWWHPLLHRRAARRIAASLQPLPRVTTVIVPFFNSVPSPLGSRGSCHLRQ